jgi:hypothetical protein
LKKKADPAEDAAPEDRLRIRKYRKIRIYFRNGFIGFNEGLGDGKNHQSQISRGSVPLNPKNLLGKGFF